MSIQTDLTRIKNSKAAIKAAIEGKGVTVPDGTMLDGMAALIEAIQAGGGGESVEISKGKITPNENIICSKSSPYSISHGLSGKPDLFFLFAAGSSYNKQYMLKTAQHIGSKLSGLLAYAGSTYQNGSTIHSDYYSCSYNTLSHVSVAEDAVKIAIDAGSKGIILVSGKDYYWFAVRWK